jgi:porin
MKVNSLINIMKVGLVLMFANMLTIRAYGQDSEAILFEASYVGDMITNFSGGIDQASAYMGMIDLMAKFDTENAGLWKNGEFYLQIENTHGATPSGDIVGDLQCFSNINNGDYTYLYQLWYHHTFNKLQFTLGVHDLNSEFLTSNYAGEYINSSFGIMPAVSMNVPVPIFPKNALGFVTQYNINDRFSVQAAIYDGDPLDLDQDPYGLNYSISSEDGFLTIGEIHYNVTNEKNLNGTYKIGGLYHNGDFDSLEDTTVSIKGNYTFYFIADQKLISIDEVAGRSLGIFAQVGMSPKNRSINSLFWSFGINYYGPISKRSEDILGIAVANASISSFVVDMNVGVMDKSETAIEFMYKAKLSENISIQPEVQYIINSGVDSSLDNAFVGLIRSYISF